MTDIFYLFLWATSWIASSATVWIHTNQGSLFLFLFRTKTCTCSLFSALSMLHTISRQICSVSVTCPMSTQENSASFFDQISVGPARLLLTAQQRPGAQRKLFSQSHVNRQWERFFPFLWCDTNLLPLALPRQLALKLFRSYSSPSR